MLVFALKAIKNFNGYPTRSEHKFEWWLLQESDKEHWGQWSGLNPSITEGVVGVKILKTHLVF